jgi:hypothetical protein
MDDFLFSKINFVQTGRTIFLEKHHRKKIYFFSYKKTSLMEQLVHVIQTEKDKSETVKNG